MSLFAAKVASAKTSSATMRVVDQKLVKQIVHYRQTTWRWQRVMGSRLTHGSSSFRTDPSTRYRRWVRDLWARRATSAFRQAHNPPNLGMWLCIHHYEASWTDSGAPYFGGLQMDIPFQIHWGNGLFFRKGTANNWTPLEQIWTAERARRVLGFSPWPSTSRMCGA